MMLSNSLSRRDFLKAVEAAGVSTLAPLTALAQDREVQWLPKEMENLGFSLKEDRAINQLVVPSLELPVYEPNAPGEDERGYLTKVSFDPKTNVAQIETSNRRQVSLEILVDKSAINFRELVRGYNHELKGATSRTLAYEPDQKRRRLIWDHERSIDYWIESDRDARGQTSREVVVGFGPIIEHNTKEFGYVLHYDPKTGDLYINRNGRTIHSERLELPGLKANVLLGRYLKLTGDKFSLNQGLDTADWILVAFNPVRYSEKTGFALTDKVVFTPHYGKTSTYYGITDSNVITTPTTEFTSVHSIVEPFVRRRYSPGREFRGAQYLDFDGRQLLVNGPNGWGQFELKSGESSLYYNPRTDTLELGDGWNTKGAKVTIDVKGLFDGAPRSLAYSKVTVTLDYGNNNRQVFPIQFNFGNTDITKAYTVLKK